jgi:hypothetical protein
MHGDEAGRFPLVESASVEIVSGVADINGTMARRHFMKNLAGAMAGPSSGLSIRNGRNGCKNKQVNGHHRNQPFEDVGDDSSLHGIIPFRQTGLLLVFSRMPEFFGYADMKNS